MIKKEVLTGFLVGLIANAIGLYLATILLGNNNDFIIALKSAAAEGVLGKLISLGAILNLLAFFVFIKKKQDYRARGVLLATIIIAISTFLFKFI
ncbi:hypothetical protein BZARG_1803 [Bizionia argentinensis JUB59]|uniref:Uncharacterized protein n=1 Tax=Bizionia argentinensis JUB59 TaxID=1046627 RepID=G2EDY6_9FLAO|nr:hypothetical protein [Bizionia argentinensis]EGV43379.1 hypothetical protein BZARG_1803 [Bizionia argentinensis JUB59]